MSKKRTFKVLPNLMRGKDIKDFQDMIRREFKHLKIYCPIKTDGIYGVTTRSYASALLRARGLSQRLMDEGMTYELRVKLARRHMNKTETKRFHAKTTEAYRAKIRKQWNKGIVHPPVSRIIADSWGYHPGVHDGLDVICLPNAPVFAMIKSRVIDVRSGGWWGKAPSGDVSKGDGIVQLQVLENSGPFRKGMHIGYGHVEHARVREGQVVEAGEMIAQAGLAVAWHVHLMINGGRTSKGIGDRDPRPFLDYSVKHG